jgi:hypothetical protein
MPGRRPGGHEVSWHRLREPARQPPAPAPEPQPRNPGPEDGELHFCCICGALILGLDLEDELDGEGPGRDICGNCNRTRNFDIELGY